MKAVKAKGNQVVSGPFGTRVRPDCGGEGKRDGTLLLLGAVGRRTAGQGFYPVQSDGPQAA